MQQVIVFLVDIVQLVLDQCFVAVLAVAKQVMQQHRSLVQRVPVQALAVAVVLPVLALMHLKLPYF